MSPFTSYSLLQCSGYEQHPGHRNGDAGDDDRNRLAENFDHGHQDPARKRHLLSKAKSWVRHAVGAAELPALMNSRLITTMPHPFHNAIDRT